MVLTIFPFDQRVTQRVLNIASLGVNDLQPIARTRELTLTRRFHQMIMSGTPWVGKVRFGRREKLNAHQAFIRQNSEAYFINCWQLFEGETLEMWMTYGKGVAIFSRVGLLKEQVSPFLDPVFLGKIGYAHKDMVIQNLINFLFTKEKHFHLEKELRVVLQ